MTEHAQEPTGYATNLKVALYAPSGGRKTLQAKHLIDRYGVENVGIISCEQGLSTIVSALDQRFVRKVDSLKDLGAALKWAKDTFTKPDQWVVVDGGSRVLNWVQRDIWSGTEQAFNWIAQGKSVREMDAEMRQYAFFVTKGEEMNTQAMWIKVATRCGSIFDSFVRLVPSIYWTFWEEMTNIDQFRKGPPYKPDTPGKGAFDELKGSFDFVGRLVRADDEFSTAYFNDGETGKYYAKRRDDWGKVRVPNEIRKFNLASFVHSLRGAGFEEQKK